MIINDLITKEIEFGDKKHSIEIFEEIKEDTLYPKCSKYDHNSHKTCQNQTKYMFCKGNHETKDHKYQLNGCVSLIEKICLHTIKKCINCQDSHFINSNFYSKRLKILEKILKLQKSRKKIEVIISRKFTYTEVFSQSKSNSKTEDFLKLILNNNIDFKINIKTVSKL